VRGRLSTHTHVEESSEPTAEYPSLQLHFPSKSATSGISSRANFQWHFIQAKGLVHLPILRLLISEPLPRRYELAQLPSDHLLRYVHVLVELAIVDAELVADQLRCDGGGALLRADDGVLARWDAGVDLEGEDVRAYGCVSCLVL
jgi:hypothetical protein